MEITCHGEHQNGVYIRHCPSIQIDVNKFVDAMCTQFSYETIAVIDDNGSGSTEICLGRKNAPDYTIRGGHDELIHLKDILKKLVEQNSLGQETHRRRARLSVILLVDELGLDETTHIDDIKRSVKEYYFPKE